MIARRIILLFSLSLFTLNCFSTTYYSQGSLDPTQTSSWADGRSSGTAPASVSSSNDMFVIQDGHTMTTGSSWSIGSGTTVQIEDGGILIGSHSIDFTSATFQIDNGGTYQHNIAGNNDVFNGTESFADNSNFEVSEKPASTLENTTYGNLTINYSSGTSLRTDVNDNETFTVNGNLIISSTGTGEFRIATGSRTNVDLSIGGNFEIKGGVFDYFSSSNSNSGFDVTVGGDLLFTGGEWDNDGQDYQITFSGGSDSININFNGVSLSGSVEDEVDFTLAASKVATLLSDFEIGSGETLTVNGQLNFGTHEVFGDGELTTSSGSTLGIGSVDGIDNFSTSGNIGLPDSRRNINTATNLIYNGSAAQSIGDGISEIGNLEGELRIENTAGTVSLAEDIEVGDNFELIIDENATLQLSSGNNIKKTSGAGSASASINGTIRIEDSDGFSASSTTGGEALQAINSITFGSNSTVEYYGGSQTITNQFAYQNLSLIGGGTKTSAGNIDIDGNLTVDGTDFDPDDNNVNIAGNWTITSSSGFTQGNSTVIFDGSSTATVSENGGADFANVEKTGSGTLNLGSDLRIGSGHTLSISSGTINTGTHELDGPSGNITMTGGRLEIETINTNENWPDFGGNFNLSGGSIVLQGSGNQEIQGGKTYFDIEFGGSGVKTFSSATSDIDGTLTISCYCTVDFENRTIGKGATNFTMDKGYLNIEGSGTKPDMGGTYNISGGTIEFSGNSSMSIRSPRTYDSILVSGTDVNGSSGFYTLVDGGDITIASGGSMSVSNQEFQSTGSASAQINGTFETEDPDGLSGSNAATFNNDVSLNLGSSSTIIYSEPSGTQTISPRTDYANLTLQNGSTKDMSGGTPEVSGNFNVSGGSITFPSSISFNGSSAQSIPAQDFGTTNITFSGGGDKNLAGDATFNGTITFTSGNVVLGNNNLTIGSSATISSANSSSYVQTNGTGKVVRNIGSSSSAIFPIGSNPYMPITIEVTSGSGGDFEASVSSGVNDQPDGGGSAITSDAVLYTWEVNTPSGSNTVSTTLQWEASAQDPNPGSGNTGNDVNMGFGETSSSNWDNEGSFSNASVSGTEYTHTRNGISLNGSSTYAFGLGTNNQPLPVELLYQEIKLVNGKPQLKWATASEINASHFEIYKSTDRQSWLFTGSTEALGNNAYGKTYIFNDQSASFDYNNELFYRIKQLDNDGAFEFFPIMRIASNEKIQKQNVHISQKSEFINIQNSYSHSPEMDVLIHTVDGRIHYQGKTDDSLLSIAKNELPQGVLIIKVSVGGQLKSEKIMNK